MLDMSETTVNGHTLKMKVGLSLKNFGKTLKQNPLFTAVLLDGASDCWGCVGR